MSVDDVLQVIVDQVRPLIGAQYAALGIVDADGVDGAVHHRRHGSRDPGEDRPHSSLVTGSSG